MDYPPFSDYFYVAGNPMIFVDPDGRSVKTVIVTGEDADRATEKLNKSSSLDITRDQETGKLIATGKVESESDRILLAAIMDSQITVRLETTDAQIFDSKDGTKNIPLLPGGFEGSTSNSNATKVTATQLINVSNAEVISDVIGEETGETIRHEINEAYYGALQNPGGDYDSAYESAHSTVSKVDGVVHPKLDLNRDKSRSPHVFQIRRKGTSVWRDLGPMKKMKR